MDEQQPPEDDVASREPPESQQPADDVLAFSDLKLGNAWGESITKQRADALEAILQEWEAVKEHSEKKGPFDKVKLSGADVFWLAARALAGPSGDVAQAQTALGAGREDMEMFFYPALAALHPESANLIEVEGGSLSDVEGAFLRDEHDDMRVFYYPSLSTLHLEGAWLQSAHLEGANLMEAHLECAFLRDAHLDCALLLRTELMKAHLEHAILTGAHLEYAILYAAHLENANLDKSSLTGAILSEAHLENATLGWAHLEHATLDAAHFERATLSGAHLEHATLREAYLKDAILIEAHLETANLALAHLERAALDRAHLENVILIGAHLEDASLREVHLEHANLIGAHLERAYAFEAHLEDTILGGAHLEDAHLHAAHLERADLRMVFLDKGTDFRDALLGDEISGYATLTDVRWGDANLAVVNWTCTTRGFLGIGRRIDAIELGDEREARSPTLLGEDLRRMLKDKHAWLQGYKDAVRANRQLATALRSQGLNEDADRFAYKAQVLQREVLRRQGYIGGYAFSLLLWALSGYGYRLWRIAAAYALVLVTFAAIFLILGVHSHSGEPGIQALWDSFLVSLSAIHGRTIFEQLGAWTPAAWMAAVESVVGIVIEGVFVAMLIQRFFAR